MAQRRLVIERPSLHGKMAPTRISVKVDDQIHIGPWITMQAARLGYPLVDNFGIPVAYRLRPSSASEPLPTTGRFANVRFPSGTSFILEPEDHRPTSTQKKAFAAHQTDHILFSRFHFSRRFLITSGIGTTMSLLGLTAGITTALAHRRISQQRKVVSLTQTVSDSFTISVYTTFSRHQQAVQAVTWAPDERMLASGGKDALVFVWQLDGSLRHTLQFHAPVRAVAWSPDGNQLIAGAANVVTFFDAHTGVLLTKNAGQHTASVTALGWTRLQTAALLAISAGMDKTAIVWDGLSHEPHTIFRLHTTAIEALAILHDSIVTTSQGGLARVWNVTDGLEIHGYYSDTQQPLRAVAFSAAGSLAIGCDDGNVRLWNDGRTCTHQMQDVFGLHCIDEPVHLHGHTGPIRAIAFSPDGTFLATGGDDKKLIIWSVQKLTPLLIQTQQDTLAALSWSPSGKFLAGAIGPHVTLWQIHL